MSEVRSKFYRAFKRCLLVRVRRGASALSRLSSQQSQNSKKNFTTHVPSEILFQIFEYLLPCNTQPSSISHTCHPESLHRAHSSDTYICPFCQTKFLLSVSLVCKSWHAIAQPLIYRVVRIPYSMHTPGDEYSPFHCAEKARFHKGNEMSFPNIYDRHRANRPDMIHRELIAKHEDEKIRVLQARVSTLQLFERTLGQNPAIASCVQTLDLGVVFAYPNVPGLYDYTWDWKTKYEMTMGTIMTQIYTSIRSIISLLCNLQYLDFHLDPDAVGLERRALNYLVTPQVQNLIWQPKLPGCSCNHVRIELPASPQTSSDCASYLRQSVPPPSSLNSSRKSATLYLYSNDDLSPSSKSVFHSSTEPYVTTDPVQLLSVTVNTTGLLNIPEIPHLTFMRTSEASLDILEAYSRFSKPSVMSPVSLCLSHQQFSIHGMQYILSHCRELLKLRLESIHLLAEPTTSRLRIANSVSKDHFCSLTLRELHLDIIEEKSSKTLANDPIDMLLNCLLSSISENRLPQLKSITAPAWKSYVEKYLARSGWNTGESDGPIGKVSFGEEEVEISLRGSGVERTMPLPRI